MLFQLKRSRQFSIGGFHDFCTFLALCQLFWWLFCFHVGEFDAFVLGLNTEVAGRLKWLILWNLITFGVIVFLITVLFFQPIFPFHQRINSMRFNLDQNTAMAAIFRKVYLPNRFNVRFFRKEVKNVPELKLSVIHCWILYYPDERTSLVPNYHFTVGAAYACRSVVLCWGCWCWSRWFYCTEALLGGWDF